MLSASLNKTFPSSFLVDHCNQIYIPTEKISNFYFKERKLKGLIYAQTGLGVGVGVDGCIVHN